MSFSERIGKKSIKTILQVESIDQDLLNRLWNTLYEKFFCSLRFASVQENVCRSIWMDFYKYQIDRMPSYVGGGIYFKGVVDYVRDWFFSAKWYEIYDLIEFIAEIDQRDSRVGFVDACNVALEKEISGYRIINNQIVQITIETEINAIEDAVTVSNKWKSVSSHLSTSIQYLSDRKSPDFRNSIKESISAVEALCKIITNDDKDTLGKALNEIEKTHKIHNSLKSAFKAIYGYTSDSSGIRHALLESDNPVNFEDAKFMLVSCSAFISYLTSIQKK